jgi:hypothetical protein
MTFIIHGAMIKGGIIMHKHILQYSHLNERGDIIGQESGAYGVCCKCFRINIMFVWRW